LFGWGLSAWRVGGFGAFGIRLAVVWGGPLWVRGVRVFSVLVVGWFLFSVMVVLVGLVWLLVALRGVVCCGGLGLGVAGGWVRWLRVGGFVSPVWVGCRRGVGFFVLLGARWFWPWVGALVAGLGVAESLGLSVWRWRVVG